MTGWLGVAGLVLALLELVLLVGVVVLAGRFWRQVEPQVRPLLSMFAPSAQPAIVAPDRDTEEVERAAPDY